MQALFMAVFFTSISFFMFSCASVPVAMPLWADSSTVDQCYPKQDYIARIGYAKDRKMAELAAESELGSYFSHTVHSLIKANEYISNTNKSSDSQKIEREITIESMNNLFDVRKTAPWFNRERKQYICCAYINRNDAWNVYERIVRDSRDKFRQLYDAAVLEEEPLRKLRVLDKCDIPSKDFIAKLENARLIMPGKEDVFLSDRKIAEGLELDKKTAKENCVVYIESKNDEKGQLLRNVSSIISKTGFAVSSKKTEAAYNVIINLEYGLIAHGETVTASPSLTVKMKTNKRDVWTYTRNLTKQSGFTAAEALVKRKILNSAENEIKKDFESEFESMLNHN
ncbi:hypothetical protein [uncultured Treponema sp.]|uniref:hypothetical protein n=1 Tax=uncultured Treponema sp. TaxID=162155 RepID=UPI0025D42160|nr:hypothetical protein [uncultured Treponema sp.]